MAKKEKIDVVNPQNMTKEEVEELTIATLEQKTYLEAEVQRANKKIRGKLWLWWLLPIFGWIIYAWALQSRNQRPDVQQAMTALKRKVAEKEIQLMLNKKRLQQLEQTE